MKARPILFSTPMIHALLAGRKTQTRRAVKYQPPSNYHRFCWFDKPIMGWTHELAPAECWHTVKCPYGNTGDLLWVRETFINGIEWRENIRRAKRLIGEWPFGDVHGSDKPMIDVPDVLYKADGQKYVAKWKPSIFMPRWASRLTLQITDIRVERLKDISDADAQAEGVFFKDYGRKCFHPAGDTAICPAPDEHHPQREGWMWKETTSSDQCLHTAKNAYGNLWNTIHGGASWNNNEWVWAISFKVHQKNVDKLLPTKGSNHE